MSAFGGYELQRNALLHKSSFIIIETKEAQKEENAQEEMKSIRLQCRWQK